MAARTTIEIAGPVKTTSIFSQVMTCRKGKIMDPTGEDLCGWELNNPDNDIFDIEVLGVFGGCKNCEHVAACTSPCESVRRLVPKEGRIVGLGHEKEQDGPRISYFALLNGDEVKFIRLSAPDHYWAKASYMSEELVPSWVLSELELRQ
ncbi:MAG: hypothetical protein ACLP3B_10080 [Syntrophobacteraceae bacterium]